MELHELLSLVIDRASDWVISQRDRLRPTGQQLPLEMREALNPYFQREILDNIKICIVEAVENPPFLPSLKQYLNIPLIDFSETEGITYGDTVCLVSTALSKSPETSPGLFFHECVHVVQYQLLGIRPFMARYVTGWAENGFQYLSIPLESHAYELQRMFVTLGKPFSVEDLVRERLAADA